MHNYYMVKEDVEKLEGLGELEHLKHEPLKHKGCWIKVGKKMQPKISSVWWKLCGRIERVLMEGQSINAVIF